MRVDWMKGAIRRAFALLVICAFILAPVIISATHGPGLPLVNAQLSDDISHGHTHDEAKPGEFGFGHDATDHEHSTQGLLLGQNTDTVLTYGGLRLGISDVSAASLSPPGLRRPPKVLSA